MADVSYFYPPTYQQAPAGSTDSLGPSDGTSSGGNGVVGKDGKSFLAKSRDPTPDDGNDGDTWYNEDTATIFTVKTAGAWPDTGFVLKGADGSVGPVGPLGLVPVTAQPTKDIGVVGGFAIQTSNTTNGAVLLYGPKTSKGWVTDIVNGQIVVRSIQLNGQAGTPGLSILTGTGAPNNSLGSDTQIYVDTDTFDAYLKTNSAWVYQRNLTGPMGLNALNAQLLHGIGAPASSTFANNVDAIYIQEENGEVWYFDADGTKTWTDSNTTFRGPPGVAGAPGLRGSQTYKGSGPPNGDLSSYTPTAAQGDVYYDTTTPGGPYIYFLGS